MALTDNIIMDQNIAIAQIETILPPPTASGWIRGTKAYYWNEHKNFYAFFIDEDGDAYFTINKFNSKLLPFQEALKDFQKSFLNLLQ